MGISVQSQTKLASRSKQKAEHPKASRPPEPQEWIPEIHSLYKETLRSLAGTPNGLGAFGEYVFGLRPAPHHQLWIDFLEESSFARLIIVAPPGHAKSTWCSIIYPCWKIGQNPTHHVLGTSVTATQSQLFSVAIRDTIAGNPRFREVFPEVHPDRQKGWGESEWFVGPHEVGDPHCTFAAAGVGGAIIGRRANEIGLDDPYDERNITTEHQRRKVFVWLGRTLRTRLVPGGRFVAVLTRWHWDDFVGKFEDQRTHTIVKMDALSPGKEVWATIRWAKSDMERAIELFGDRMEWTAKMYGKARIFIHSEGPALWPSYWSQASLEEEREALGIPIFNCMYQGDPGALSGDIFTIDSFRNFPDPLPIFTEVVQFWDTALSQKTRASYTVGITAAKDINNNLFILCVRRGHYTSKQHRDLIEGAFDEDRQQWPLLNRVGVEKGLLSIGLLEEMGEQSYVPIEETLPKGDKLARIRPAAAKGEAGRFFVDQVASWWPTYRDELIEFDRGRYDDQADATSGVHNMLFPVRPWKKIKFLNI